MKKIILLSASLLVLAACTGADRPACWKANTKSANICNSSNGGGFSMKSPNIKGNTGKRGKNNDVTTPDTGNDDTPTSDTNENDNPSPPEEDTTQDTNPNQLNSNDVEGFDPFGGLYGPGT